jgi:hypothetical protein
MGCSDCGQAEGDEHGESGHHDDALGEGQAGAMEDRDEHQCDCHGHERERPYTSASQQSDRPEDFSAAEVGLSKSGDEIGPF